MIKRNICVVTGSRADYGYLKLIIQKIQRSEKLKLTLLVTGMHLLKKYGNTVDLIKNDGIPITKTVSIYKESEETPCDLGISLGQGIINFTKVLFEIKPDLLLVLGDRFEILAAVLAASTLFIPIAHIHGGDNVNEGQIDEQIRHSITKFSHIHFPATENSAKCIKSLGEEKWRIHMVGSPTIDALKELKLLNRNEFCQKLILNPSEKIILCVFHPYTFEANEAGEQMALILNILENFKYQTIIIYPNNDPGNNLIISEIEKRRSISFFKIFKNLDQFDYLSALKNADLLIGNSSSGIIESPFFKIPVVNLGSRNKGRETSENVINANFNSNEINSAITKALSQNFKKNCQNVKNPYGDGNSSNKIIKILESLNFNKDLLIKKFNPDI